MHRRLPSDQPPSSLDRATLDFLYPCHFTLDAALAILDPGPGLARVLGRDCAGARLGEIFQVEGGGEPASLEQMARFRQRLVVLVSRRDGRLRLRGVTVAQPDGRILFLLSPIVADGAAAAELNIDFDSLSPMDASAELVMASEMQRVMAAEALELTARLMTARDDAVQRQAFFDSVIQLLPVFVLVKDARDGRYLLVNRAAEDAFGIDARDILGRSVFDLFPADEAARFAAEDAEVVASGEMRIEEEEIITTRSLGERYFVTRKVATYGPEGARFIVSVGEDVTERCEANLALRTALTAAEQASVSKSAFLANMSHEIRTPLNGIVAVADLMSRSRLDPADRELLGIIRSSGETLGHLLADILDQARIESGRMAIEDAPFHLGDVVRATAALCRLRADERGVPLEVDLAPDLDRAVMGDSVRVRQVLTNLLSNAVKFTDAGKITLTVGRIASGAVRFVVRDTGVGFDPQTKDRIFGRFQQADDSITRKFGGTGLGLTISRDLCELMGGMLDGDGEPGVGSAFWFDLPLPPTEAAVGPSAPAGHVPSASDDGARDGEADPDRILRILVADDHPTNRKVVELMLCADADVVSVVNGAEAVEAFRAGGFDVILMDMQMPVMDGLTAVREIRRLEGDGARVPIIMLTANALPEHVAASHAAGADRHLEKPFTTQSLTGAINDVLAAAAARRADAA